MAEPGPQRALDLVGYQEGSIVSRQILHKKTGSVTLFAFDEGQELSEHTSPFEALLCVLEGEGRIEIASQPFQVKAGEMMILPANRPHAVKAAEKLKILLIMLFEVRMAA